MNNKKGKYVKLCKTFLGGLQNFRPGKPRRIKKN